jgi:hypothetical protein
LKAKQKKKLDYLVMTEGNFTHAGISTSEKIGSDAGMLAEDDGSASIFSALGLKSVLGIADSVPTINSSLQKLPSISMSAGNFSSKDVEAAMTSLEDDEDVSAMKTLKAEEENLDRNDFDENAVVPVNEDDDEPSTVASTPTTKQAVSAVAVSAVEVSGVQVGNSNVTTEEKDSELEFAEIQAQAGFDIQAIENTLRPVERYALSYRINIEGYMSMFAMSEQQKLAALSASSAASTEDEVTYHKLKAKLKNKLKHLQLKKSESQSDAGGDLVEDDEREIDIEAIEQLKEEEEYRAFAAGELLGADVSGDREVNRHSRWYQRERARRMTDLRRRALTGESWKLYVDSITKVHLKYLFSFTIVSLYYFVQVPFWCNDDTGEACYGRPKVVEDQEIFQNAVLYGLPFFPKSIIVHILSHLEPLPDRNNAASACVRWWDCSLDSSLVKRVLPIERLREFEEPSRRETSSKHSSVHHHTHPSNIFVSIESALSSCVRGDTIILEAGHYWERSLILDKPVRFRGETDDPSRVIIELKSTVDGGSPLINGIQSTSISRERNDKDNHQEKHAEYLLGTITVKRSAGAVQFSGITIQRSNLHSTAQRPSAVQLACPILKSSCSRLGLGVPCRPGLGKRRPDEGCGFTAA